jgi:hypothetical protein
MAAVLIGPHHQNNNNNNNTCSGRTQRVATLAAAPSHTHGFDKIWVQVLTSEIPAFFYHTLWRIEFYSDLSAHLYDVYYFYRWTLNTCSSS